MRTLALLLTCAAPPALHAAALNLSVTDATGKPLVDVVALLEPASGKAMVKRLAPTHADALQALDRAAAQKAVPATTGGGSVDLF